MSLLHEVDELRKVGAVRADLRQAATHAVIAMEKAAEDPLQGILGSLGKDVSKRVTAPIGLPGLAAFQRPLMALAVSAGLMAGGKAWQAMRISGVEDEVVRRARDEYLAAGPPRTQETYEQTGVEARVHKLYRDLASIAPDIAQNAAAATAAIRLVLMRPHQPNFTDTEIANFMLAQKARRDLEPVGGKHLTAVSTIFKMVPEMTGTVGT